jgi:hypothetical protein
LAGLVYALRAKLVEALAIFWNGLHWGWFGVALGLYVLALGFISWRLQLVLRVQGVKVSYPQAFYLCFIGCFFTLFFPSALGGDVAKGYFAYQYSGKKMASLTGVVLDRLLGFSTLILIAGGVFLIHSKGLNFGPAVERSIYGGLGLLIVGSLVFASRRVAGNFRVLSFLVPSEKWRQELSNLYHGLRECLNHKKTVLMSLGISVTAQFLFFVNAYFLARSLGVEIALWTFFLLMPLVGFVSMAPSLSGLGVREAGFVFFFKPFMAVEQAFALSLLYDLIFYGASFAAGVVFAFKGGLKREVVHDLETAEKLPEVRDGG